MALHSPSLAYQRRGFHCANGCRHDREDFGWALPAKAEPLQRLRAEKRVRNQMTEPGRRLTYRAYVFGPDNHIIQPPKLIAAFGDEQVIETARRMVDGHALEVWDEQRLVIRLETRTGPELI